MSERLRKLREQYEAKEAFPTDEAGIAWLGRKSWHAECFTGPRSWTRLLARLAANVASRDGLTLADAWFKAAHALAAAVADPEDTLAGIDLAAHARTCKVGYKYPEGYASLFAAYREIYPEWEPAKPGEEPLNQGGDFHGFVCDRLDELRIGILAGLPNDERIPPEMCADTRAIASSSLLLWDIVSFHTAFRRQYGLPALSSNEVQELVLDGGKFLWACYHARVLGISRDELTEFVSVCKDEWFPLMEELLARSLLRPGVLLALVGCSGDAREVVAQGADLIAAYFDAETDMSPLDYLNRCLSPAALDA